jgi:hypothetical protein
MKQLDFYLEAIQLEMSSPAIRAMFKQKPWMKKKFVDTAKKAFELKKKTAGVPLVGKARLAAKGQAGKDVTRIFGFK